MVLLQFGVFSCHFFRMHLRCHFLSHINDTWSLFSISSYVKYLSFLTDVTFLDCLLISLIFCKIHLGHTDLHRNHLCHILDVRFMFMFICWIMGLCLMCWMFGLCLICWMIGLCLTYWVCGLSLICWMLGLCLMCCLVCLLHLR